MKIFTALALSFEEVAEEPHFEKLSYWVKKKIIATLDVAKQQAVLKLTTIDQSVFCAFDATVIFPVKGSWGDRKSVV